MPASIGPGCFTSSLGEKSLLMRKTRTPLGLLKATRMCSDAMSRLQWIGRTGSGIEAPCLLSAPVAGSIARAVT